MSRRYCWLRSEFGFTPPALPAITLFWKLATVAPPAMLIPVVLLKMAVLDSRMVAPLTDAFTPVPLADTIQFSVFIVEVPVLA